MSLDKPRTVSTEYGVVEGTEVDGLHFFRNVPYAAAPFGPRRFRPPTRPEPWDGVRDATQPNPAPLRLSRRKAIHWAPSTALP